MMDSCHAQGNELEPKKISRKKLIMKILLVIAVAALLIGGVVLPNIPKEADFRNAFEFAVSNDYRYVYVYKEQLSLASEYFPRPMIKVIMKGTVICPKSAKTLVVYDTTHGSNMAEEECLTIAYESGFIVAKETT